MALTLSLHNGDCLEVMSLIPDGSVDLILTDLPYNEVNRNSNGLRNLDKGKADELNTDITLLIDVLVNKCSGSFYLFCPTEQVSLIRKCFVDKGLSTRHCIWEKTNPSPMNGQHIWLSSIENCIFAKKPKATFNEHCKSPVWRFPNGTKKFHPTGKNQKLFDYLVATSSKEGDLVLDCFMGSGTTGVACLNTKRSFIGIEKDEHYFQVGKERLEKHLLTLDYTPQVVYNEE